ncbi:MAG TPA: hypothetical protein VK966_03220 [Longimicrobiales bacterium]|nr:hypothetical protein [Longimicrobiales bacterium]
MKRVARVSHAGGLPHRRGLPLRGGVIAILAVGLAACGSPEAERVRGGGPGADLGNRDAVVEMHGGALPYADTPCLTSLPECTGPMPVSGLTLDEAES